MLPMLIQVIQLAALLPLAGRGVPAPQDRSAALPTCFEDLGLLKQKVEQDYAGFQLEITGDRRRAYDQAVQRFRAAATRAEGDACYFLLRDYVAWFNDPHLFVYQSGRIDSAESARRAAAVRMTGLDEAAIRKQLVARIDRLDPLEGIWYDQRLRLGVVADPAGPRGRFIAVVLTPDTATWRAGAVRATFTRRQDGTYDAEVFAPNYARRLLDASIHRRVLLRLSPGIWGKEFPLAPVDSGQLDPVDAHRPTLRRRPGTVIVAVPSHDPAFIPLLDSLLKANEGALDSADRFIVDLRGNEGGASFVTDALYPWFVSPGMPPAPELKSREGLMLSSPDQIAYAQRAFGSDTSAFVRGLVARLTASPGALVPLYDTTVPPEAPSPYPPPRGQARVGFLVDRGTVSASEVILLDARQSARVTTFGEPTAGALDYQSVNIVRLGPEENRWFLGYPTITRNRRLPEGGMRGKGIVPEVRLDLARLADPIGEVERALSRR